MDTPPSSPPKKQCPGAQRNHREWHPFGHGRGLRMIDGVYYCNCRIPQKLRAQQVMSNRNGNQGRWYYNCPSWDPENKSGCGLYAFEDELEVKHRTYEMEWNYQPCETSWWIDPTTKPLEGVSSSAHLSASQQTLSGDGSEVRPGSHYYGEDWEQNDESEMMYTAVENSPAPTFAFEAPRQWSGSQAKKYKQMYLVAMPNDGISISSGTSTVMNGLESFELSSQRSYQHTVNSVTSTPSRKRKIGVGLGNLPTPSTGSTKIPRNTLLVATEPRSGSSSKRRRETEPDELPATPTTSRTINGLYAPQVPSIEEEDEYRGGEEGAASVNRLLFPRSSQVSSLDRVVEVVEKLQRDITMLKERDRMRSSQETVDTV
ncbi:hypothetical protein QBC40DRAFT_43127 [Triangularia verruculosa]|uniref:Zinc finger GRF-type domain-containing protein n=1 Tax=Triangularia verruculosa TaxID=2587418 RepID=A0AAN7AVC2_9PEZI|nr:hypothetical protein QBC40DRAFT_43127 [Triangularia verruculosa]